MKPKHVRVPPIRNPVIGDGGRHRPAGGCSLVPPPQRLQIVCKRSPWEGGAITSCPAEAQGRASIFLASVSWRLIAEDQRHMKGQSQEVKGHAGRVKVLQGRRSEGEDLTSQRRRIPTQVPEHWKPPPPPPLPGLAGASGGALGQEGDPSRALTLMTFP